RAVALGPVLPRALQGDAGALAMASIDRFDVRATDTGARGGFEALYARTVGDLLSGTGRETFEAVRMLRSADAARIPPANGAEYPRGRFFEARDLAVTTDFRTLFSEVASGHLGVSVAPLFPGWKTSEPPLGLFA